VPARPLADLPVAILAGGLGTRLRPALPDRPKALAPIGDRTFLERQIALLRDRGARRFVLCVGWEAERIEAALGDGGRLGVAIEYSAEGPQLLGTGGALRLAAPRLGGTALVVNGDTWLDTDYGALVARHREEHAAAGALATLAVTRTGDRARSGTVLLDAAARRVVAFREKDPAGEGWVSAGTYVIEPALVASLPADEPRSLEREVFPAALAAGRVLAALAVTDPFFDIGTPETLAAFRARAGRG
jgi:NDP-sugar pyrophosphorylase family protein